MSVMQMSEQGPRESRNGEDFFFTSCPLSGSICVGLDKAQCGAVNVSLTLSASVCAPRPVYTCYCFSDSVSLCRMLCASGHLSRSRFGSPCMRSTSGRLMKEQTDDIVLTKTCL